MNGILRLPQPVGITERFPAVEKLAAKLNLPVWVLDLETTGFGAHTSLGIVEFASIQVPPNGQATGFSTLINPEVPIHWAASKVHGINEHAVKGAPTFPRIVSGLRKGFHTTLVCGFNSRRYDLKVIEGNAVRYEIEPLTALNQLDVRDMWIGLHGNKGTLSLAASTYQVAEGTAHRAHGDVLTTVRLLNALISEHGLDFALQYQVIA